MPRSQLNNYSLISAYNYPVNNQIDYSKYRLSRQGHLYKESNSWKKYLTIGGVGLSALLSVNRLPALSRISFFPMSRQKKVLYVVSSVLKTGFVSFVMGTGIDVLINSSRAKRTDELADLNSQQLYY